MIKFVVFPLTYACDSCGQTHVMTTEIAVYLEQGTPAKHIALCNDCLKQLQNKLNFRQGVPNATEQ